MPMRIRYGPISLNWLSKAALLLLLLVLCISCTKEEMEIVNLQSNIETQVLLPQKQHLVLLTLTFAGINDEKPKQVKVTSSTGTSSWILTVAPDEQQVYRIGPLSMGPDLDLPTGEWTVEVIGSDGRVVKQSIEIEYRNVDDLVSYDRSSATLRVLKGSAQLSQFDVNGSLLDSIRLQNDEPFVISEAVDKLTVDLKDYKVRYIIQR